MRHLGAVVVFVVVGLACGSSATEPGSKSGRVPFAQLFQIEQGRITPKRPVRVGSVNMSPAISMGCGVVTIGGIDLCTLEGHELVVEPQGDTLVVTGVVK